MHRDLRQRTKEIKGRVAFNDLFRELFPDNYEQQGNSRCPFHPDEQASFQLSPDHGYCHAGCTPNNGAKSFDVISLWMKAKGVTFTTALKDLAGPCRIDQTPKRIVNTYDYRDENGNLLFQTLRYEPKNFMQRRPNGSGGWIPDLQGVRRVIYRLPEVVKADEVWFAEGEKDADNLVAIELCGTTSPLGAGKWQGLAEKFHIHEPLKGKTVYVLPDNDQQGRHHAEDVACSLRGFAASARIIDLPGLSEKGDVSDFIEMHGADKAKALLLELAEKTDEYQPALEKKNECETPQGTKQHEPSDASNLTDMGNAQRLARLFGERIRFSKQLGWLVYNGKRWLPDDESQVQWYAKETVRHLYGEAEAEPDEDRRKALAKFAMKCESASRIQAMLTLLPSEPGISVLPAVFDHDKMLLNLANGSLDLHSGQLRPHSPEDLITKLAPVNYDPTAKCERWERFILEVMDGDEAMRDFLQRSLGYTLTGETKEQAWFFLWGKGENGKTTLLSVLERILGDYYVNTPADTFVITPGHRVRDDLARLRGARLVSANEAEGKTFDAETLKAFTGEGSVTARELYHRLFDYMPEGKLFFSANNQPEVKDTTHAFWRRILLIPFTRQFTGDAKDPNLRGKLADESAGILAWMVRGCLDWQENGLQIPEKVKLAVNDYRDSVDILKDFLETHCIINYGLTVPVRELYGRYSAYCDEHKIRKAMSPHKFNNKLLGRPGITRGSTGPKAKRVKSWFGIGLQESALRACSSCNFDGEPCREFGIQTKDATKCQYYETYC
jgi:putative DNA primase/helicase